MEHMEENTLIPFGKGEQIQLERKAKEATDLIAFTKEQVALAEEDKEVFEERLQEELKKPQDQQDPDLIKDIQEYLVEIPNFKKEMEEEVERIRQTQQKITENHRRVAQRIRVKGY